MASCFKFSVPSAMSDTDQWSEDEFVNLCGPAISKAALLRKESQSNTRSDGLKLKVTSISFL